MQTIAEALLKLQKSSFRSRFHLDEKDKKYFAEKGRETIERHARDFVKEKLTEFLEPVGDRPV